MKHIKLLLIPAILISTLVNADQYNFYFPQSAESDDDGIPLEASRTVKIINASTYTTYDGNMSGYYDLGYGDLQSAANNAVTGASFSVDTDYTGTTQEVLDFVGSNLTVRENRLIFLNDSSTSTSHWYDRITTTDVASGEVQNQILVAESQAAYDIAEAAGYTVKLSESSIDRSGAGFKRLTTFSKNITNSSNATTTANTESDGGLISEKIVNDEGTSIFREESDGTIHIGANSIVLSDETVSNSGYDQISSSSNVLELGNSSAHRTVITGTLEVQEPTAPNHAATKKYVDGNAAMSAAIASMPTAPLGKSMLTAGMGHRDGSSAIAVGYTHTPESGNKVFNLSISHSSHVSKPTYGGGIGWSF